MRKDVFVQVSWSKMLPDRLADSDRRYFIKLGLLFYLLWVVAFETVGLYAATLPTHDLTCSLDQWIPLIPQLVWPYLFCYVFPFLLAFVGKDWHRVNCGLLSILFANLTAFVVFMAFPVAFPKPDLGGSLSERALALEYAVDFHPGGNNFPSLHVAFAWLVYFMSRGQGLKKKAEHAVLATALLITVSTLFVKQHIVADVVAGILWASAAWIAARFFYPRWREAGSDAKAAFWRMVRKSAVFAAFSVFLIVLFALRG